MLFLTKSHEVAVKVVIVFSFNVSIAHWSAEHV